MRKLHLIIAFACMGWTVKAQDTLKTVQLDEVVITGTKSEIPVEKSGKSIFKTTRKDIEQSSARSVADLLNEVPGVQMDGNFGPLGTNVDYFVRGARSKSTLILIDGVPFNDASGIDQTYDLRLLNLEQVESIEVLKGGLSTLYGTGAAAGVINISLKKASSDQLGGNVGANYGSFNTFQSTANLSGTAGNSSFVFNGGYKKSDGFSAAKDENENGDFDNDGFEGFNLLAKYDIELTERFTLGATISYDDFTSDFDASAFADSETNFSEYSQLRGGIRPSYTWNDGNIHGKFFINKLDRFFETDFGISDYDAKNHQADVVVNQNLSDQIKIIGGVNYQRFQYGEQPDFETFDFSMFDPYTTFIYDNANLTVQLGGRLNIHSDYGQNFVWNFNPSYLIESGTVDVKVFGSYATAFIAPSLTQLYGPFGANPDLNPEESQSAEGGFSLLGDKFKSDIVYFYRKDENLIIYNSEFQYANAEGEIETDGVEVSGSYAITDQISWSANYTYTRRLSNETAYRIPKHKFGTAISVSPVENLSTRLSYLYTGDRPLQYFDSNTFQTVQVTGDAFGLLDFKASYTLNSLRFSASLNNILDEDYVAIAGYNVAGRNYNIGLNYSF
ncbi:TonB-dependent receptor plug domain-containing protein [Ekhidna sp.]|uniref:TonB-dependent receptor plug domain-containing protein n=1 Tax=Ekhidna sp. TaxID=2608089 RepID=UPI0035173D63